MRETINEFIARKSEYIAQYPHLTVFPNLITLDGPDGAGKSSIAKPLVDALRDTYGDSHVLLVDPTNVQGSQGQDRLAHILHTASDKSPQWTDLIYSAGINRAYKEIVVPAILDGLIVVCDRSEVDLLRFALESQDALCINRRMHYIANGTMTNMLWAGNRIFIHASPKDLWENLQTRPSLSIFDPHSEQEAEKRLYWERMSEQKVMEFPCDGCSHTITVENQRTSRSDCVSSHLTSLAQHIMSQLVL